MTFCWKSQTAPARAGTRGERLRAALKWLHENFVMVPLLCGYPILGATIAAYVLAGSDQGRDLLVEVLERSLDLYPSPQRSATSGLLGVVWFGLALLGAGLLFWYSSRLLLQRRFKYLQVDPLFTACARATLPRLLGASTFAAVAVGFGLLATGLRRGVADADTDAGLADAAFWAAVGTAVVTVVFFAMLVARRRLFGLAPVTDMHSSTTPLDKRLVTSVVVGFLALSIVFACFPVAAPRFFGAPALVLMGVSMISFVAAMLIAYWPLAGDLPSFTLPVVAAIVLFATWLDNHPMRAVSGPVAASITLPDPQAALDAWASTRQAAGSPCQAASGASVPVVFVAAAGGGIRAAYWTARVLEEMSDVRHFNCSVFALSGVSGGSLGIAGYVTTHFDPAGAYRNGTIRATDALSIDFLSPAVGGLLFYDALQRFIPWSIASLDRSRALEQAWTEAFQVSGNDAFAHPLQDLYRRPGMPLLLLNSTVVEDGKRAIHAPIDTSTFSDVHSLLGSEQSSSPSTYAISLSSAVHNSARFTYVSPAGRVSGMTPADSIGTALKSDARLVDGGYFENSGAATVTALLGKLTLKQRGDINWVPVLLLIRNQPGAESACGSGNPRCILLPRAEPQRGLPAPSRLLPEVFNPLEALMNTREARERIAVSQARDAVLALEGIVIEAYLPSTGPGHPDPPLGWSLSRSVRKELDDEAHQQVENNRSTLEALPGFR